MAGHTGFGEAGVDDLAVGVGGGEADEGLGGEVLRLQHRALQQRVAGGQHGHLVGFEQQGAAGGGRGLAAFGQAQVVALFAEFALQQRRLLGADGHAGTRVRGNEAAHRLRQQGLRQRRQTGQRQAALRKVAQRGRGGGDALQPDEGALHLLLQRQRAGGGAQAAADALEQCQAQHLLQPRQLAADGGLGGVQQLGRPGGVAGEHQAAEDLDLAVGEFHRQSISRLNR